MNQDVVLQRRLARLETEMMALRRHNRSWKIAALSALVVVGLGWASTTQAVGVKRELRVGDATHELRITPTGLEFTVVSEKRASFGPEGLAFFSNGKQRIGLDASTTWSGLLVFGEDGAVALSAGTEQDSGTAIKVFSSVNKQLRLEMAERLLDAGSGVRVYDAKGHPRATLYTERRGETGLEITDANRQPRIDIYAQEGGASVLRAMDGTASAVSEMSVMPEVDAGVRVNGIFPDEVPQHQRLVPMLYLLDPGGTTQIEMPVKP